MTHLATMFLMRSLTLENRHKEWEIYEGWAMENGLKLQLRMPTPYHLGLENLKNSKMGAEEVGRVVQLLDVHHLAHIHRQQLYNCVER